MTLLERINAIHWLRTPDRFGIPLVLSHHEELIVAAVQEELDAMRRSIEKLKSKMHRMEHRGEEA